MITKQTLEEIIEYLDKNWRRLTADSENSLHSQSTLENELSGSGTEVIVVNPQEGIEDEKGHGTSLSNIQTENTLHKKLFRRILFMFETFNTIYGIRLKFDWSPADNFLSPIVFIALFIFWFLLINTQFFHYRNGDYLKLLECFALYGYTISCTMKWFGFLRHRYNILSLVFSIERLCNTIKTGGRAAIIARDFHLTIKFLKAFVVIAFTAIFAYLVSPIKEYVFHGKLVPIIPVNIPYCDPSTLKGFIYQSLVQAIIGVYSTFGVLIYGSSFVVMICFYKMQLDLFREDFKDLDKMWSGKNKVSLQYKYAFLVNVWRKRMDTNSFLDVIKDIYEFKLTLHFIFNYLSQILCLFEVSKLEWTSGIFAAFGLFTEMAFYFIMGTLISVADEDYRRIVYDSNWYAYDKRSQQIIWFLLHESELSKELVLGFIGPLNIVTGVTIVKSVYSYYTVLEELF